ncbi:MAG: ABC transporter permease [Opitutaceae bacterium]|jgi:putative ABC transport system permease protein
MALPLSYNIRSLLQRKSRTILTILGIAAVISIFVAMVSFSQSLASTFARTGSPDNVVVLQKSAFDKSLSSLPKSSNDVIRYFDHIRHKGETPLASPELSVEPWASVPGRPGEIFMMARGIEPVFFDVMDQVKVVQGSRELRGNKLLIGPAARYKLGGAGIGDTVVFFGERWTVGGLFEAKGSSLELLILADLSDLMRAARRDELSSFTLKAASVDEVAPLVRLLEADRRVLVTAMAENDYYVASGKIFGIVAQLGLLVSIIVSLGAIFGGMNTMYTAVAGRTREIGTLRALGFSGTSILVSFLVEAVFIGISGGVLGVALGMLVHGARVNVMTASIQFSVTPSVAAAGLALSIAVGLLGGLLPAFRASRLKVVEAIKHA